MADKQINKKDDRGKVDEYLYSQTDCAEYKLYLKTEDRSKLEGQRKRQGSYGNRKTFFLPFIFFHPVCHCQIQYCKAQNRGLEVKKDEQTNAETGWKRNI